MINKKDKKLILFPPKTGSTSLRSFFEEPLYGYERPEYPRPPVVHMNIDEAIDFYSIKDIKNWKIYQTARNPMTRVPSAFMHQKAMSKKRQGSMDNIKFENFVENLIGKNDLLFPNNFLRGQARFYFLQTTWADSKKYNVTYLKLEKDNSKIYSEMGFSEDFKLPHKNRGNFIDSNYEHLHTDKTKEIIKSLYEDDFIKLNYE